MKRRIASILVSLVFGWLTTAAIAEDETTSTADSTAAVAETTPADPATETASSDAPKTDDTTAAAPAESENK
jgi:hypothetical protein